MARRLITLALVTALVLAAVLLVDNPTLEPAPEQAPQKSTPGAVMTQATIRQYNDQGQLQYVLQVERAEQFFRFNKENKPLNTSRGYTDLSAPKLTLHNSDDVAPWHISAEHGRTDNNGNRITLWGDVVAHQALADGGQYRLNTQRLVVNPAQQTATSDQPVTLLSPEGTGNAVGMSLDLLAQTVTLESQVKAIYEVK